MNEPKFFKFSPAVSIAGPYTPESILAPVCEFAAGCIRDGFRMPIRITVHTLREAFTMTATAFAADTMQIAIDGERPDTVGLPLTATVREIDGDRDARLTVGRSLELALKPEHEVGLSLPRRPSTNTYLAALMLFSDRCVAYGFSLPLELYVHMWRPVRTIACKVIAGPYGGSWFTTNGRDTGFVDATRRTPLRDHEMALTSPATVYVVNATRDRMLVMHITDWGDSPPPPVLALPGLPGGARLH